MPARGKTFPCGHVGKGRFCHRCAAGEKARLAEAAAEAARRAQRAEKQAAFDRDVVDLRCLQSRPELLAKAREILQDLAATHNYLPYKGKRMNYDRTVISVPIGYHYRLLVRDEGGRLTPLEVLSHEDYNRIHPGG